MENKICTTIEQSKKLLELGIDVNTADMCWQNNEFPIGFYDDDYDAVPAWSLSALLNIITDQNFTIKCITGDFNIDIPIRHCKLWFTSLLDAAFEMVCWLKEMERYELY